MIDFNIKNDEVLIKSDVNILLQQIDILFDTTPGEVLGYEEYGTKYDYYLYDLNLSADSIKQAILSDINSLNLLGFTPDVEVLLLQGTEQDIAIINITLTKNDEMYNKSYKITGN